MEAVGPCSRNDSVWSKSGDALMSVDGVGDVGVGLVGAGLVGVSWVDAVCVLGRNKLGL